MPLGVKRPFPGGSGDEDSSAKKPAGEPDGKYLAFMLLGIHTGDVVPGSLLA